MSKERIDVIVSKFIDAENKEHYFVLATVSEVLSDCIVDSEYTTNEVVKGLKLGWSVCSPEDSFDKTLGVKIAVGRAKKNENYALYATKLGYINSKMVRAFLEQEAEYFSTNPGAYIKGYKRVK